MHSTDTTTALPSQTEVVDLFAGPRGWSEGLATLGLADVGIEWDADACATAVAAGHLTIRADVSTYPPEVFTGARGVIASPPCPDFSLAGSGMGRSGKSGWLVDEPVRWVEELHPEWVVCEQVPGALPVWHEHAHRYRALGYSVWCGVVNAADYGVPQTRTRAVLLASRVRSVARPPVTHARQPTLFGLPPWVTMSEACGWPPGEYRLDRRQNGAPVLDVGRRPAPTLTAAAVAAGIWTLTKNGERVRLSVADALAVQSFRGDYPLRGSPRSQHEQIGNAVPPLLAAHLLAAVLGVPADTSAPTP